MLLTYCPNSPNPQRPHTITEWLPSFNLKSKRFLTIPQLSGSLQGKITFLPVPTIPKFIAEAKAFLYGSKSSEV